MTSNQSKSHPIKFTPCITTTPAMASHADFAVTDSNQLDLLGQKNRVGMSNDWAGFKLTLKKSAALFLSVITHSNDAMAQTTANNGTLGLILNQNFWLIVIAVIASIIIAKHFHQSGSITVYENYTDLAYTIGTPLFVWTVSSLLDKTSDNRYATNFFLFYLALHILWIFYTSFRANNSDLKSVVVAILKIFLSSLSLLVMFFTLFAIFGTPDKKNESNVEYRKRMVGIALTSVISAWVLSYIGKGLCREKKFVSPSEYLLTKKPKSNDSSHPYLTIASALSILGLMGYLLFSPSVPKHSEPKVEVQTQKHELNLNATSENTPASSVNSNTSAVTDFETGFKQLTEKFDSLQPNEQEQLVKQINSFLPQTENVNGMDVNIDSISLVNNLIITNMILNKSVSQNQLSAFTSAFTDDKRSQMEANLCVLYYSKNVSKNPKFEHVAFSKDGVVIFKINIDYPKCTTEPLGSKVRNLRKLADITEVRQHLYSKLESLNDSEKQQIIDQINLQLPVTIDGGGILKKTSLTKNIIESESIVDAADPNFRQYLLKAVCPMYTSGELAKSVVLSQVLKSPNGELLQKVVIGASDCN